MAIHIDFSGYPMTGVFMFRAKTGRSKGMDNVMASPKETKELVEFLKDIRNMPEREWQEVLEEISWYARNY
jgi:hypothetical protein